MITKKRPVFKIIGIVVVFVLATVLIAQDAITLRYHIFMYERAQRLQREAIYSADQQRYWDISERHMHRLVDLGYFQEGKISYRGHGKSLVSFLSTNFPGVDCRVSINGPIQVYARSNIVQQVEEAMRKHGRF